MKANPSKGTTLAQAHAGRFRVVPYEELRAKATGVAAAILSKHRDTPGGIVIVPILMGGGLPSRLVVDALMPSGIVKDVVPCRIRRYVDIDVAGEPEFTVSLPAALMRDEVVVGIDDLVDAGATLADFVDHARDAGAAKVETGVIYVKPHSVYAPTYFAEDGVTQWLILPGEEHDFMNSASESDKELAALSAEDVRDYFEELGLPAATVKAWADFSHEGADA